MDPVAFTLGPFNLWGFTLGPLEIRWYGIMMATSMMLGALIGAKLLRRMGRNGELVWDGLFWIILAGIAGARLIYVLTNWGAYSSNLTEILMIHHGGLSFHGGVIAGGLATYYYFRSKGIPFLEVADSFVPGVSLGIILVRIGNFMNGDILGYEWSGPWALNFPWDELHAPPGADPTVILRHPTEIYGLLVGVFTMLVSIWLWRSVYVRKTLAVGSAFVGFILTYSLTRSVIEDPFRSVPLAIKVADPVKSGFGMFTESQIISILLVLVAIWAFARLRGWEAASKLAPALGGPRTTRQQRRAAYREKRKRQKPE